MQDTSRSLGGARVLGLLSRHEGIESCRLENVGVCFCGNKYIGADLKANCRRFSKANEGTFFRLHKENF